MIRLPFHLAGQSNHLNKLPSLCICTLTVGGDQSVNRAKIDIWIQRWSVWESSILMNNENYLVFNPHSIIISGGVWGGTGSRKVWLWPPLPFNPVTSISNKQLLTRNYSLSQPCTAYPPNPYCTKHPCSALFIVVQTKLLTLLSQGDCIPAV